MMSSCKKISVIILLLILSACAKSTPPFTGIKIGKPYEINGKIYTPAPDSSYDKIGDASWYGPGFDGNKTASGEIFEQDDITAAHPTLPMPSLVLVTNLSNKKTVVVRINDRGPFHKNRIIDLSKKSAEMIDLKSTKPVRVQYLDKETKEYIASIQGKSPKIDMVAYNENYKKKLNENSEDVVAGIESNVTEQVYGNSIISSSAPVQSVLSSDLKEIENPEISQHSETQVLPQYFAQEDTVDHAVNNKNINTQYKSIARNTSQKGKYIILAGSFSSEENARKLENSFVTIPNHKKLVSVNKIEVSGKEWWRVNVGAFSTKDSANEVLRIVQDLGVQDAILKAQ